MLRTRARPLPAGRLGPHQALGFGATLSALGLLLLFAVGGWLPLAIGALSLAYYLLVYTAWLKPRSPQAVVVGGAVGAVAPVLADAAAHGSVGLWSLVLFAIVFLWQPPHVWAITLYRKDEFAAAGFPVMPTVIGDSATRRLMFAYALALVAVTLLPGLAGVLGSLYTGCAVLGGAWFLVCIRLSMRAASRHADRRVFRVSLVYLGVLFLAMLTELMLL